MREIKFRGKRVDSRGWVFGSLVLVQDKAFIVPSETKTVKIFSIPHIHWDDMIPVDPATIGQLRYVKDGVEYYDGDVYRHAGYGNEVVSDICELQYALYAGEAEDICEIIGNLHDNPELLNS